MNSGIHAYGNLNIPHALRLAHNEARYGLVHATRQRGAFVEAVNSLSRLCLPHFEWEEKTVFPILGLMPELKRGIVRPEMAEVLPIIADFSARQDTADDHHQMILSAIIALLQAVDPAKNKEVAEFAYNLRVHEKIEDDVVYPTVLLIGEYLREKLLLY